MKANSSTVRRLLARVSVSSRPTDRQLINNDCKPPQTFEAIASPAKPNRGGGRRATIGQYNLPRDRRCDLHRFISRLSTYVRTIPRKDIGILTDAQKMRKIFQQFEQKNHLRWEPIALRTKTREREVEFVSHGFKELRNGLAQCDNRAATEWRREEQRLRQMNARLLRSVAELRRRNAEMRLLNRMHEWLQACATEDEIYRIVGLVAEELFSDQRGYLAIVREREQDLQPVARWGDLAAAEVFSIQDCWALRRGQVHTVIDPEHGFVCSHFVESPKTAYRCFPLIAQGETLGVFCLIGNGNKITRDSANQLQAVRAFCEAAKLSLYNLRLRAKLNEQAIRDPLTGLYNRRFLEETLWRDLARCQRRKSPLSVVMLDLDHFKRFNDLFGHDTGDLLLRGLGTLIRENLRKGDLSCRYGGDEFVLVLPDSNLSDTQRRVGHICELLKTIKLPCGGPGTSAVTVSAGIAGAGVHGFTPNELLRAADTALYAAKKTGRDRVVCCQSGRPNLALVGTH